jgi:hypothetical protein
VLFSEPCCDRLEEALAQGDKQMFRVMVGDEQPGVLVVSVCYIVREHEGQMATVWIDNAVLFCPFCGTQLQTQDAIDELLNPSQANEP